MTEHHSDEDCYDGLLDAIAYTKASIVGDVGARAVIAKSCKPSALVDALASMLTFHLTMMTAGNPVEFLDKMAEQVAAERQAGR